MFSSLARYLWTYQAPPPDLTDDMGQQTDTQLPSPVQAPGAISRKSSSFTLDRSRGPSHVAWRSPTSASPSPSRRSWPPRPGTRTSTPPSLAEGATTPATTTPAQQRGLNRMSSESFHLQSMYYLSDLISESEIVPTTSQNKPLPPVDERAVEFPVTIRRPSTDSVPMTPDSARPSDGHPSLSAASPTTPSSLFLTRPLNRTISQSSTSTLGTAVPGVVSAPTIPPLDLRPNFSGSLGLTPRRSQLQPPSLPTVIASPRPPVSVIYEDSDIDVAESFRTAPSPRSSVFDEVDLERGPGAEDPFADPEDYDYRVSTAAATEHTEPAGDSQSHMSLPRGIYDEIDLGVPEQSTSFFLSEPSLPASRPWSPEVSALGTIPRRSVDSNDTMVDYAIKQRWRKGLSFGSHKTVRATLKARTDCWFTSANVLFWLGFVAPWCWLIGGWYLSRNGEFKSEGQFARTVPWQERKRKQTKSAVAEKGLPREKHRSLFWRTRHEERKHETMPMTPVEDNRSVHSLQLPPSKESVRYSIDPWVARCRIAAITSGVLLVAAVVVALIVLVRAFA